MKPSSIIVAFAILLVLTGGNVQARHPDRGPGIPGTVTEVTNRYFLMKSAAGLAKVFCTANTNYKLKGEKSDSSCIKKGARVRVTGTTTDGGLTIDAWRVNVVKEVPPEDDSGKASKPDKGASKHDARPHY